MTEEEILNQAKVDVSIFVDYVMEEIECLSYKYHYERSWVCEEFKKQLNERIRDNVW